MKSDLASACAAMSRGLTNRRSHGARLNRWFGIAAVALAACVLQSPQSNARESEGSERPKWGCNVTDSDERDPVDTLLANAVIWLREARGDVKKIEAAIARYLKEGDALELSPHELRDYFDISSPSLPEQANYSQEEQEAASAIYTRISRKRYGS